MGNFDFSLWARSTAWIYKEAAIKATSGLLKSWLIVIVSGLACVAFIFLYGILGNSGFGGGLLLGLISAILLALYYSWLSEIFRQGRLTPADLRQLDYGLFFALINVGFILFIAALLIRSVAPDPTLMLYVNLAVTVIFNALPETILVHRHDGLHALSYSATFTRENWIEWYLPLLLIIAPWILIDAEAVVFYLAQTDPLLPVTFLVKGYFVVSQQWGLGILLYIPIALLLGNWFMLFRLQLFSQLESGTRRRRMFEIKQR